MDMFSIRGGIPLRGTVAVSGAKNAALPLMAASLAAEGLVRLRGVPELADVATLSNVLRALGMRVERDAAGDLLLESIDVQACIAPYELVRTMRASVCVLGPLLARRGKACVSLPGGCNIGQRPIDLHLRGLAALGARIRIEKGYVIASAPRLKGAVVDMAGPYGTTVTGTCNVLMAAVLAKGTTTITSAACEPEVVDLGSFLKRLGARIGGLGTSVLTIEGQDSLQAAEHSVIPDRIEAATLIMAAAATRGRLTLTGARPDHLETVIRLLRSLGVEIEVFAHTDGRAHMEIAAGSSLRGVACSARPFPGIPTDVQAQLTSLLTQAEGVSIVTDTVFPNRFMHVAELCRMGADIRHEGDRAVIRGRTPLQGTSVMASDLRASAGLVIAALAAEGESQVRRIYHLDRGYERLETKLQALGALVHRVKDMVDAAPRGAEAIPEFRTPPAKAA